MIESKDAQSMAATLATNLHGVSRDANNFARLPDEFWGYYARGHDSKGTFGMIIMYSHDENDVDKVIGIYEKWLAERRSASLHE